MIRRPDEDSVDMDRVIEQRLAAEGLLNRAAFDSSVLRDLFNLVQEWRSVLLNEARTRGTASSDHAR